MKAQRGFALLEAVAAVAIVSLCASALVLALSTVAKSSSHMVGPNRAAALSLAGQTLRTAQNAWKYGSPGSAPSGSDQTPAGTVVSTVSQNSGTAATITIAVTYTPDPGHDDPGNVTVSGNLRTAAPLPGAQVIRPGMIPDPQSSP